MKNSQGIILILIVIAALVGGAFLLSTPSSNEGSGTTSPGALGAAVDSKVLNNDSAPVVGNKDAKVKLVVFSDYLCPYCKSAHSVINDALASYPDASMQFRNLIVHEDSRILAQAAEAANLQGKYKEMNDALYSQTVQSNEDSVVALAKSLGLDITKFKSDLNSDQVKNRISQDEKDATALQVSGTPSLFINNQAIDNYTQLGDLVKKALGK